LRKGKCRKSGLSTCRVPDVQHLILMTRGLCRRFEQRVCGRMLSTRNVGFGDITRVRGVTDMGAIRPVSISRQKVGKPSMPSVRPDLDQWLLSTQAV
jgi:hypothetical protein